MASTSGDSKILDHRRNRYLQLCFSTMTSKIHRQIDLQGIKDDQALFRAIRAKYIEVKWTGVWMQWISPAWAEKLLGNLSVSTLKGADFVQVRGLPD